MKLYELFDNDELKPEEIEDDAKDLFVVNRKIGSRTIEFYSTKDSRGRWDIEFSDLDAKDHWALSGKGSEVQVFAFIMASIKHLIKSKNPEIITFTSKKADSSRTPLYKRLMGRFKDQYDLEVSDDKDEGKNANDAFVLTRKGSLQESMRHVESPEGSLTFGWKTDLEEEEERGYIPKGYSKRVLELGGIYANDPGQGQGDALMKKFLASPEAQEAELIFLDPVPGLGSNFKSKDSDEIQIRRLQAFYRKYGFRNNPKANRMWLVLKGTIPDNKLPT